MAIYKVTLLKKSIRQMYFLLAPWGESYGVSLHGEKYLSPKKMCHIEVNFTQTASNMPLRDVLEGRFS